MRSSRAFRGGTVTNNGISAFNIEISSEVLDDLRRRLDQTRWSSQVEGSGWEAGTDLDYLKQVVDYWRSAYDWRTRHVAQSTLPLHDRA